MTPEHKHIAGLDLALNELAEDSPMAHALGEYHLRPLIQKAKSAPLPDAELVELRALLAGTNYSASGDCHNARVVVAAIARIDAAISKLTS